jgi:hypothetical protein
MLIDLGLEEIELIVCSEFWPLAGTKSRLTKLGQGDLTSARSRTNSTFHLEVNLYDFGSVGSMLLGVFGY